MRRILFGFLAFAFFALVWVSCDTKARCTPQLRNAAKLVRTSADGERDTISIQDSIRVGDTIRMSLFANGLYNYLTSLTVASEPEMSVSLEWSDEMSHCLASDADPAKGRLIFVAEEVYACTTVLHYTPIKSGKYRIEMLLSSDAGAPYSPAQYYFDVNVK
jgi:hypothetical protein